MIHFAWPLAWLLLPLPLLTWWLLPVWREQGTVIRIPFFKEMSAALPASRAAEHRGWLAFGFATLLWTLLVGGLARPQLSLPSFEREVPTRDLILALDLSRSMDARDFIDAQGNKIDRFTALKQTVEDFIKRRKGDRIGLVVFGDQAYVQMPLTLDHAALIEALQEARTGMAGDSTAIGDAVLLAVRLFEKYPQTSKTLILMSDGEDTASRGAPRSTAALARERGVSVHTVGITAGLTGSAAQMSTLRDIAQLSGGQFFQGSDRTQLEQIYQSLDRMVPVKVQMLTESREREITWLFALATAILVLIWQCIVLWNLAGEGRKHD